MALAGKDELARSCGYARHVRGDRAHDSARARPLRMAAAGKRILERADSRGRGGAVSRNGYDAIPQTFAGLTCVKSRGPRFADASARLPAALLARYKPDREVMLRCRE